MSAAPATSEFSEGVTVIHCLPAGSSRKLARCRSAGCLAKQDRPPATQTAQGVLMTTKLEYKDQGSKESMALVKAALQQNK